MESNAQTVLVGTTDLAPVPAADRSRDGQMLLEDFLAKLYAIESRTDKIQEVLVKLLESRETSVQHSRMRFDKLVDLITAATLNRVPDTTVQTEAVGTPGVRPPADVGYTVTAQPTSTDILDQPVSKLRLQGRALNCLYGCSTLRDVVRLTPGMLSRRKNCGTQTIQSVVAALAELGLTLGGKGVESAKRGPNRLEDAVRMLTALFAKNTEVAAAEILELAGRERIPTRTLYRAKANIRSRSSLRDQQWFWCAPKVGTTVEAVEAVPAQPGFLQKDVRDIGLPGRIVNPLRYNNIFTVSDLCGKTGRQLLAIQNIGYGSVGTIETMLAANGLRLA